MVVPTPTYEECRRKRLEENKRRMEQLNLHKLSQSLKKKSPNTSSPMKKVKAKVPRDELLLVTPLRRSTRVAEKPPPNYKEGLPVQFCKTHLPKHDGTITLVDEDGNEWETKYLAGKTGLSGGWRGFSIDHQLVDGDALIFQLVKPATFKVHIVRVSTSEVDEEGSDNGDERHEVGHVTNAKNKSPKTRNN
ncbi:hypothetical protein Ancab_018168 [Ancistrocladus abbreviatus]